VAKQQHDDENGEEEVGERVGKVMKMCARERCVRLRAMRWNIKRWQSSGSFTLLLLGDAKDAADIYIDDHIYMYLIDAAGAFQHHSRSSLPW